MIIVAGFLNVEPSDRDIYLARCSDIVEAARATAGCVDFQLGADLVDPGRINVFEAWEDVDSLEAFRGDGTDDDLGSMITSAEVRQYVVESSTDLSG